jgi:hypothetical protein
LPYGEEKSLAGLTDCFTFLTGDGEVPIPGGLNSPSSLGGLYPGSLGGGDQGDPGSLGGADQGSLGGDQVDTGLGGDHGDPGSGVAGDTGSLLGEATGKLAGGNGGLNCLGSLVGVQPSPPAT